MIGNFNRKKRLVNQPKLVKFEGFMHHYSCSCYSMHVYVHVMACMYVFMICDYELDELYA